MKRTHGLKITSNQFLFEKNQIGNRLWLFLVSSCDAKFNLVHFHMYAKQVSVSLPVNPTLCFPQGKNNTNCPYSVPAFISPCVLVFSLFKNVRGVKSVELPQFK